eukprot:SAG22_NODE_276_length_13167_cov_8.415825_17_plen_109_part_00
MIRLVCGNKYQSRARLELARQRPLPFLLRGLLLVLAPRGRFPNGLEFGLGQRAARPAAFPVAAALFARGRLSNGLKLSLSQRAARPAAFGVAAAPSSSSSSSRSGGLL